MKTSRTTKTLLVSGIIALALICSSFLPQSGKKYLTMSILQTGVTELKIVVINEDGKIEETPLGKGFGNVIENQQLRTQTMNNLLSRGYQLVGANGQEYIFERK